MFPAVWVRAHIQGNSNATAVAPHHHVWGVAPVTGQPKRKPKGSAPLGACCLGGSSCSVLSDWRGCCRRCSCSHCSLLSQSSLVLNGLSMLQDALPAAVHLCIADSAHDVVGALAGNARLGARCGEVGLPYNGAPSFAQDDAVLLTGTAAPPRLECCSSNWAGQKKAKKRAAPLEAGCLEGSSSNAKLRSRSALCGAPHKTGLGHASGRAQAAFCGPTGPALTSGA